jgi:CheY-specific phosphatase CheX
MIEICQEMLEKVIASVLEEAAFIFAERSDESWGAEDTIVCASLKFSGEKNGTLYIAATSEFTGILAANLLGLEMGEEDTSIYGDDAIKELTNIVGGELLSMWLGAQSHYEMGVPVVEKKSIDGHLKLMETMTSSVELLGDDEYRIDIGVIEEK